ncbi:MAG: lytic transglycosylase domain-containing protein [Actinomycetota bacterium]|nr:lytic transglycosylase domain-containing protein [Actinomycetota bacterium]
MRAVAAALTVVAFLTAPLAATLVLAQQPPTGLGYQPTLEALGDIPGALLALYQQAAAQRCPGLPWPVLAAIGKVETGHGRNLGISSAGARGPMQFLPSTWVSHGVDGDGDGLADIDNPVDAVHAAASYLCAAGGGSPATLRDAIFAYNHAQWYVDLVLEYAARYAVLGAAAVGADVQSLLANPRLILTANARADLAAGIIDPRLVALLAAATQRHAFSVSVFKTGHTKYVAGTTRVSNHWCGQAADVFMVDGQLVSPLSAASRAMAEWLQAVQASSGFSEVGTPWADLAGDGFFSNAAHQDHLHIGFGPRCADL